MRIATLLPLGAIPAVLALLVAAPRPDAVRGRDIFEKRCTGCHELDRPKVGPPLRGIFGRPAARAAQFTYSDALKGSRVTWNETALDKWLTDPDSLVPGTDMSFRLDKPDERADIIAYLRGL